jgi:hypothetical protein
LTSRRIHIEDAEISEVIEINAARDEIRAFGLIFHATSDAPDGPVSLRLSGNGETLDLTAGADVGTMTAHQRVASGRLTKFCATTNVVARIQRVRQVLQQTIAEGRAREALEGGAKKGIHAQFDLSNCIWDILALIVDWASVVLACGPAIIVPIICVGTIAWATYETVIICRNMPNDCAGG